MVEGIVGAIVGFAVGPTLVSVTGGTSEHKIHTISGTQQPQINGHTLNSPMVGVVYLAPEPGADAFVKRCYNL